MGSVHSKISGRASSRPRGWQHFFSNPYTIIKNYTLMSLHLTLYPIPPTHVPTHDVGPKPSKNCDYDLAVASTGIGLVFN